jgi:hypothetical protein
MNHEFAGGHQSVPGLEIERDGRPHVDVLRKQAGTCHDRKNRCHD